MLFEEFSVGNEDRNEKVCLHQHKSGGSRWRTGSGAQGRSTLGLAGCAVMG